MLEKSKRLLSPTKESKDKIYTEVECIGKDKTHKRYEFGCKVSLAVTHKQGLILSSQALHGNPYDGHTLAGALVLVTEITGRSIRRAFVDKGYKKHGVKTVDVIMSGQEKLSRSLKKRNAVEPHIGHMKTDGKLGQNYLKGTLGDKINALLVAIGHNLRLILNYIRYLLTLIMLLRSRLLFIPNRKIKTA